MQVVIVGDESQVHDIPLPQLLHEERAEVPMSLSETVNVRRRIQTGSISWLLRESSIHWIRGFVGGSPSKKQSQQTATKTSSASSTSRPKVGFYSAWTTG